MLPSRCSMILPAGALNWSPHIGFLFLHSYWRTVLNDKQANFLCSFDLNFLCFFSHTMCNEFVKEISSSDFWLQEMRHHGLGVRWWLRISWWPWNMYLPTKASRKTLFPFLLVVSSGGICLMCTHDSMSMDLAGLFLPITVSMLCYSKLFVICLYCFYSFPWYDAQWNWSLNFRSAPSSSLHPERPAAGSTTSSLHHDRFVQRLMEQSM